ncbi:MAG: T9SS type A sorting domain-containing protein [Microscillaceae bacterium]|nr:T9SS type A sorting domain-containing protein [Microscillaceae bacterium]
MVYSGYQHAHAQCIPSPVSVTIINSSNTVVNSYYPGDASVVMGSMSIPVSTKRGTADDISNGDLLIVMQMQGVEINITLPDSITDTSGSDGDYADGDGGNDRSGFINNGNYTAGQYEYVVADGPVTGGLLPIRTALKKTYIHDLTPSSTLGARTFQVVRVANYQDLILSAGASITALAWNGRSGGIIAIDVNNVFALDGTIQATGMGFRGGARSASEIVFNAPGHRGEGIAGTPRIVYDGSQILNNLTNHNTSVFAGSYAGISTYPGSVSGVFDSDRGLGAPANAGGAGYLDGGGSGGSNGGSGGFGSQDIALGANHISKGAISLDASDGDRLFMGGGGGSGGRDDDGGDNDAASCGQPGGGIIIIRADQITGTGFILANGLGGFSQFSEGAGGGGAGGTVLIHTSSSNLSGLAIFARGGNGNSIFTTDSDGGGGGGGGGNVLLNRIGGTFTGLPFISAIGGAAGLSGTNTSAASGGSGGLSISSLPGASFVCSLEALPITLLEFNAEVIDHENVLLSWITAQEINNAFFSVERSRDGFNFKEVIRLDGAGNSSYTKFYEVIDQHPESGINYYRLKQTDLEGKSTFSKVIAVELNPSFERIKMYPNPTQGLLFIESLSDIQIIRLWSVNHQLLLQKYVGDDKTMRVSLDMDTLPQGIYLVEIVCERRKFFKKLWVKF